MHQWILYFRYIYMRIYIRMYMCVCVYTFFPTLFLTFSIMHSAMMSKKTYQLWGDFASGEPPTVQIKEE